MRILLILILLCLAKLVVQATQIEGKELSELLAESDHVLVCRVVRVQMVDERGKELHDRKARTGPGLKNELRLHVIVEKDGVLKTNAKKAPEKLVIPLWQAWHYSLGQWKDDAEGKTFIFLLKGEDFQRVYQGFFNRELSEKSEIEKIIREQKEKTPNQGAAANRRPAGQLDGSGNLAAVVAADRAFPAAVAELGR